MDWLGLAKLGVAVATGAFSVGALLRRRHLSRPRLMFDAGISSTLRKELPKEQQRWPLSTLAFGGDLSKDKAPIAFVPFVLENIGSLPIKGIRLQLEFPTEFACPSSETLNDSFNGTLHFPEEFNKGRKVSRVRSYTQVSLELPIIRPGEILLLAEPVQFLRNPKTRDIDSLKTLLFEFEKLPRFRSFVPMRVFLYTEDLPLIRRRLHLFWFDTNSIADLGVDVHAAVWAFWAGRYPTPGVHLVYPWEKLLSNELCQIIMPKMQCGIGKRGTRYAVEIPLEAKQATMEILMPPKDYYDTADW